MPFADEPAVETSSLQVSVKQALRLCEFSPERVIHIAIRAHPIPERVIAGKH
jgi:hypothetical protein